MIDAFVVLFFGVAWIAVPASQFYALRHWYQLVKLIDEVPLTDRRKVGWPDIHHDDPRIWFAASWLSSQAMMTSFYRVLLLGLPESRSIPSQAFDAAKRMRRCMLFAFLLVLVFAIYVVQAYGFVILIAFVLACTRWFVGNWKDAAYTLEATSQ